MIFVWWSDALKRYSSGHILLEAATVEEARARAVSDFLNFLDAEREEIWEPRTPPEPDEDDIEEREKKLALFRADIAKEPRAAGSSFFIEGSE